MYLQIKVKILILSHLIHYYLYLQYITIVFTTISIGSKEEINSCTNGYICSFWVETLCQGQKNSEANFCFPRKKWLFFRPKGEKQFFQRETNVLLRVFLTQA